MEELESSDPTDALKLIRLHPEPLRAFRRVELAPKRVTVFDINGNSLAVDGVGWETVGIGRLLSGLGASFDPGTLNDPPISGDRKEYVIVKADPWGQDRAI